MDFEKVFKESVDERFPELNAILQKYKLNMYDNSFDKALYDFSVKFNKVVVRDKIIESILTDIFTKKFGTDEIEVYDYDNCFKVSETYGKKESYVLIAIFEDETNSPLSICISADYSKLDVETSTYPSKKLPNIRVIDVLKLMGSEVYYGNVLYNEIYKAIESIIEESDDSIIISEIDDDDFQDRMDYNRTGRIKSDAWLKRFPLDDYPVKYDYSKDH